MNSLNGQSFGKETVGVAIIPFAAWASEDSVTVIGQVGMKDDAVILCSVVAAPPPAGNDDIISQDWSVPLITEIVANTGFNITLKPSVGVFKGPVTLNWSWRNV